jgi:hypothetical protein
MADEFDMAAIAAHEAEWDKALGIESRPHRLMLGILAGLIVNQSGVHPEILGHYFAVCMEHMARTMPSGGKTE